MKIVPVILCGGSGTRLWPLSRSYLPKQFLPLISERTMLQETALRVRGIEGAAAPIAIANEEHRFLAAEQLREISTVPHALLLEPAGRGTAAAAAAAALMLRAEDPDSIMLLMPADHAISKLPHFHAAIRTAAQLASQGSLVVFGIAPSSPHTGYGYIRQGAPEGEAFAVERFVEKPNLETAKGFLAAGGYFWNSGIFVFRADRYLSELQRHRPDIVDAVSAAMSSAQRDVDFVRPGRDAFLAVPDDSIDRAVMERTRDAVVVPAKFTWSDVGSWSALWALGAKDAVGNVSHGDVMARDSRGSYLRSEGRLIAAVGRGRPGDRRDQGRAPRLDQGSRRRCEAGGRRAQAQPAHRARHAPSRVPSVGLLRVDRRRRALPGQAPDDQAGGEAFAAAAPQARGALGGGFRRGQSDAGR